MSSNKKSLKFPISKLKTEILLIILASICLTLYVSAVNWLAAIFSAIIIYILLSKKTFNFFKFELKDKNILWFSFLIIIKIGLVSLFINLNRPEFNINSLLSSIVSAPVAEEIIYRALFLGMVLGVFSFVNKQFDNLYLKYSWAILIGVLFGLMHNGSLAMDWLRIIGGIIYGVGFVYSKGNLAVPIVSHMVNNIISLSY